MAVIFWADKDSADLRPARMAEVKEEEKPALSEDQTQNLEQITAIVEEHMSYLDYSPTGTGKTRVSCQLAKNYDLGLFVVCPKPAKDVWLRESEVTGARLEVIMTLGQLAGKVGCRLSHSYLLRHDTARGASQYKVTPDFEELVETGILLILDEAHHGKNITTCIHAAFSALSQYIAMVGGVSRVGLLSATIIDKAGLQCMAAIELLGLAPLPLYVQQPGRPIRLTGFTQLLETAALLDPRATAKIRSRYPGRRWTAAQVADEVSRIFVQIVIPSLGSTMNPVMYKGIQRHYFYKYFDLGNAQERYDEAVEKIDGAARDLIRHASSLQRPEREPPPPVKALFGIINTWLVQLDCLLIAPVLRQARQWLEGDPSCKVVVCLNVILCDDPAHRPRGRTGRGDHVEFLMEQLAKYNPIRYTGSVREEDRVAAVDLFQQPNTETRVIVATSSALKESISLHDTSGTPPVAVQIVDGQEVEISANAGLFTSACRNVCAETQRRDSREPPRDVVVRGRFPRKAVVMPSYRMTAIHQIAGRFYRFGVSSDVELAIALGKGKRELRSILNSLASKSALLALITRHAEMGVLFPGDYEVEIEGKPSLSEKEQQFYRGDPSRLLQIFQS